MRIAILTLPLYSNYGGIMQNYALQTVLKRKGYEVYTIDCPEIYKNKLWYNIYKDNIKRILKDIINTFGGNIKSLDNSKNYNFIQRNIIFTSSLCKKNSLKELNNVGLDAIIVGSDQVWRYPYIKSNFKNFFLDFIHNKDVKKIAFSASFGTDSNEYPIKKISVIRNLLSKFCQISVREKSGLNLLIQNNWNGQNSALMTLDPTLLLDKKDYNALITNNKLDEISSKKLFCYILDRNKEKLEVVNYISKKLKCESFIINVVHKHNKIIIPSVETWLKSFKNANYIFTDSFHGCVFSIIFNKPFIVLANPKRGIARFETLLKLFNLKDRIIYKKEDLSDEIIFKEINWEQIEEIKKTQIKESIVFLENALRNK